MVTKILLLSTYYQFYKRATIKNKIAMVQQFLTIYFECKLKFDKYFAQFFVNE